MKPWQAQIHSNLQRIVPAINVEMRRKQDVKLQLRQKILISFHPSVNQHSVLMRVTDHLFDDPVTVFGICICHAEHSSRLVMPGECWPLSSADS